ncbi:MAG: NAD(P)-binding domain-containing protein [Prevotella sp.]|nr:NAD(P)-binding domain-containing protein [Prevotella sp.]
MKISIIGVGAMGGAMAEGFAKCDNISVNDITVADPDKARLQHFASLGMNVTTDNCMAVQGAGIVMVVVKPWLAEMVIKGIKSELNYSKQTLIVVCAGLSSETLKQWLDKGDNSLPQTFLVIPNIAIAVMSSMTFIVPVNATAERTHEVADLFNMTGMSLVTEERLLGAGTTLASCGIAYAMRYVRASVEGGVELGFKAADARNIVLQTVKGAVDLLLSNGNHPEAEIDKVTTPGGLTIKGLNEMEHAGFTSAVIRGLKAGM